MSGTLMHPSVYGIGLWFGYFSCAYMGALLFFQCRNWNRTKQLYGRPPRAEAKRMFRIVATSAHAHHLYAPLAPFLIVIAWYAYDGTVFPWSVMLAVALFQTYVWAFQMTPPAVLFLGTSRPDTARLRHRLERGLHPYRVVSLLNPPKIDGPSLSTFERQYLEWDNLWVRGHAGWQTIVRSLMDICPCIVIDVRTPAASVIAETCDVLDGDRWRRAVFIINDDEVGGVCPVLTAALSATGSSLSPPQLRLISESNVIPLLKSLGLSRTASPDDLLGKDAHLRRAFRDQRDAVRRTCVRSAVERQLDVVAEARRLLVDFSIGVEPDSVDYREVAMAILVRYPPEVAMAVTSELPEMSDNLAIGGELVTSMMLLDVDFTAAEAAKWRRFHEIRGLVEQRTERVMRAAAAVAYVLFGSETLEGAVATYGQITQRLSTSPRMKQEVDSALLSVNPTLGRLIMSGNDDSCRTTKA